MFTLSGKLRFRVFRVLLFYDNTSVFLRREISIGLVHHLFSYAKRPYLFAFLTISRHPKFPRRRFKVPKKIRVARSVFLLRGVIHGGIRNLERDVIEFARFQRSTMVANFLSPSERSLEIIQASLDTNSHGNAASIARPPLRAINIAIKAPNGNTSCLNDYHKTAHSSSRCSP